MSSPSSLTCTRTPADFVVRRWSGRCLYPGPLLALMEISSKYRGSHWSLACRAHLTRRACRPPGRMASRSLIALSCIDHDLEPAPEHALAIERHRLRVHHLRQALVLHDLGHDAVAMRARLVHDVREHHRLAGFELDALRKRRALARLDVVGRALVVLEGAVLAPDFSGKPRQIAIGRQLSLRDRYHDCVDVIHLNLLEWLSKPTLPRLHTYVSSPGCRSSSS